jgi:hypothetical protein
MSDTLMTNWSRARLQVYGPRGVIAETTILVIVENHLPWFSEFGQKSA